MRWFIHLVVMFVVALLTANLFYDNGAGFGFPVPDYVYYAVAALVGLMPVTWAVLHLGGGLLLGIAGGGVLDGLRLGFLLGMGMAISKLWPSAFGVGLGVFLGGGPLGWSITALVVGGLLFGLDKALHFFWQSTTSPKGGGD